MQYLTIFIVLFFLFPRRLSTMSSPGATGPNTLTESLNTQTNDLDSRIDNLVILTKCLYTHADYVNKRIDYFDIPQSEIDRESRHPDSMSGTE